MKLQEVFKISLQDLCSHYSFCSSFSYQAKAKHPAYTFWWDSLYEESLKLPMRGVIVMIMQPSF